MKQDWLASFDALMKVHDEGAYSNIAINESMKRFRNVDASFVQIMVKGVLRNQLLIDQKIDGLARRGIKSVKARPLIILRMSIFAVDMMNSVPDYAAVNEAVKLSKRVSPVESGFINALLRTYIRDGERFSDDKIIDAGVRFSFPNELAELIRRDYGENSANIFKALSEPKPVVLRCNLMLISRENLIDKMRKKGYDVLVDETTKSGVIVNSGLPVNDEMFRSGLYSVQSSSSIEAIEKLNPRAGSRVLDLCAAPGGKSVAIAELMKNEGEVVACDIHPHRISLIEQNVKRMKTGIITTKLMDATIFDETLRESFDYVVSDVPCSGIGVIPNKPELKYRIDVNNITSLIRTQEKILSNGINYLKKNGTIMYSTCTLNKDENENVLKKVLVSFPDVEIVESKCILPYNNKIGFYYCIMKKNG